jgi:hypothetical protein
MPAARNFSDDWQEGIDHVLRSGGQDQHVGDEGSENCDATRVSTQDFLREMDDVVKAPGDEPGALLSAYRQL